MGAGTVLANGLSDLAALQEPEWCSSSPLDADGKKQSCVLTALSGGRLFSCWLTNAQCTRLSNTRSTGWAGCHRVFNRLAFRIVSRFVGDHLVESWVDFTAIRHTVPLTRAVTSKCSQTAVFLRRFGGLGQRLRASTGLPIDYSLSSLFALGS